MARTARQTFDAKLDRFKTIKSELELKSYVKTLVNSDSDTITHIWQVAENMAVKSITDALDNMGDDSIVIMYDKDGGIEYFLNEVSKRMDELKDSGEPSERGALIIKRFGRGFNDAGGVREFLEKTTDIYDIIPQEWKIICVSLEDNGLDGLWPNECTDMFVNVSYWPSSGSRFKEDDDDDIEDENDEDEIEYEVEYDADMNDSFRHRFNRSSRLDESIKHKFYTSDDFDKIVWDVAMMIEDEYEYEGNELNDDCYILFEKDGAYLGTIDEFDEIDLRHCAKVLNFIDVNRYNRTGKIFVDYRKLSNRLEHVIYGED